VPTATLIAEAVDLSTQLTPASSEHTHEESDGYSVDSADNSGEDNSGEDNSGEDSSWEDNSGEEGVDGSGNRGFGDGDGGLDIPADLQRLLN
jgi:hypothetical protein